MFLGFLFPTSLFAQSSYQFGALPSLNINKKLKNDWSINSKIESRQLISRGVFGETVDTDYQYVLTDISALAARKVGLNSRIGGGYLLRIREMDLYHRFTQQYTIVQKLTGYRLAHRFSSDQTFSSKDHPEFRLRYRITSEIPLNGESVDPNEFYLKLNNEYLSSWRASGHDIEVRLVPLLGYDLSANNKIETGLDYRINSFLNNNTRHSFWISVNWYIEI